MKNKNKESMISFDEFLRGQYKPTPWHKRLRMWFRMQIWCRILTVFGYPTIQGITFNRGLNIRRKGLIIRNCTLMTEGKEMVDIQ